MIPSCSARSVAVKSRSVDPTNQRISKSVAQLQLYAVQLVGHPIDAPRFALAVEDVVVLVLPLAGDARIVPLPDREGIVVVAPGFEEARQFRPKLAVLVLHPRIPQRKALDHSRKGFRP
jgi:hypothetical protein